MYQRMELALSSLSVADIFILYIFLLVYGCYMERFGAFI